MDTQIQRRQLYEAIWSTPIMRLVKKYGLSDVGLAKACKRHRIPRPGPGYWSKKKAGWADPPPPLPAVDDPRLEVVSLAESDDGEIPDEGPRRHAIDEEVNRRIEDELAGPAIAVPAVLRDPHPLVFAAVEEHTQAVALARQRKTDPHWHLHHQEPEPRARANVSAQGKETVARAFRIMDTLLKALEERGYSVRGKPQRHGGLTLVTVLGQTFDVRLYEPSVRRPHVLTPDEERRKAKYGSVHTPRHDVVPTGRLLLEFRTEGGWLVLAHRKDGVRIRLETTLKDLIIAVLRKVDQERQANRERERQAAIRRQAEEAQRIEQGRLQREAREREREAARVQGLLDEVDRWKRSWEIRAYLDEIKSTLAGRGQVIQAGSQLDDWMKWALAAAHRLDPLRPPEPPTTASPP